MKITENIIESTIKYLPSAIFGFFGLLIGSLYSEALPIILPAVIQQMPKTLLLKLLMVATILFVLSFLVSCAMYFKLKKKLIPKFGVLWDKNKEAYCPACEIVLSEYHEQDDPPIYELSCVKCNAHIRLMYFGKPISLKNAQELI